MAAKKRSRVSRKYVDGDLVRRVAAADLPRAASTLKSKSFALPPNWIRDGLPCTHVVYRYTRCRCGKWRRDRSFENRI